MAGRAVGAEPGRGADRGADGAEHGPGGRAGLTERDGARAATRVAEGLW